MLGQYLTLCYVKYVEDREVLEQYSIIYANSYVEAAQILEEYYGDTIIESTVKFGNDSLFTFDNKYLPMISDIFKECGEGA